MWSVTLEVFSGSIDAFFIVAAIVIDYIYFPTFSYIQTELLACVGDYQ